MACAYPERFWEVVIWGTSVETKGIVMSLGFYRLIKGKLIVRARQSPDGDSMRFVADDMSLFDTLPRHSPPSESGSEASYQLRFQAIDTPELHYGGAAQPHGVESRNILLEWLAARGPSRFLCL